MDTQEPAPVFYGPLRRAPAYYAGNTYRGHHINYPDVERYGNGVMPGKRDKAARRVIRAALKRLHSRIEKALGLPRAMMAQALEIAKEQKKSVRWGRRLFDQELKLHTPAPQPVTRAAARAEKRRLKRLSNVP